MQPLSDSQPLDAGLRALRILSVVASVIAILVDSFVPRSGPEFNDHEVLLLFLSIAQLGFFVLAVIYSMLVAASRGGLQLTRVTAGMGIIAIVCFVGQMLVLN